MKTTIKNRARSTFSIIAATMAVLAYAASTGRALANQPEEILTKKVTYGDLNLESPQGAKVLYARLRFAARQVCIPLEGIELARQKAWQNCVDNALSGAVGQVNKASVTALHNQTINHSAKS